MDPAEINKNIMVKACNIGDIKEVLTRLNARLNPMEHKAWLGHIGEYKEQYPLTCHEEGLSGPYLVSKVYEKTKGCLNRHGSRAASDVGGTVLPV